MGRVLGASAVSSSVMSSNVPSHKRMSFNARNQASSSSSESSVESAVFASVSRARALLSSSSWPTSSRKAASASASFAYAIGKSLRKALPWRSATMASRNCIGNSRNKARSSAPSWTWKVPELDRHNTGRSRSLNCPAPSSPTARARGA